MFFILHFSLGKYENIKIKRSVFLWAPPPPPKEKRKNRKFFFLNVWWHDATLLVYFSYFITYIHTFIQSHSYNTFIRRHSLRPLSISSSLVCSVGEPPCGAEPRIELGPALQQADALPTELRRTILSYAAPCLSYAAPSAELRRTIRIEN